jgi:hypothetical protein
VLAVEQSNSVANDPTNRRLKDRMPLKMSEQFEHLVEDQIPGLESNSIVLFVVAVD